MEVDNYETKNNETVETDEHDDAYIDDGGICAVRYRKGR